MEKTNEIYLNPTIEDVKKNPDRLYADDNNYWRCIQRVFPAKVINKRVVTFIQLNSGEYQAKVLDYTIAQADSYEEVIKQAKSWLYSN